MAIFSKKDKSNIEPKAEKAEVKEKKNVEVSKSSPDSISNHVSVLKRPRITEKASDVTRNNVYVFDVEEKSTKKTIEKSFMAQFKVKPLKIRTMPVPKKKKFIRGHKGVSGGGKKAYIYLKEGDKIDII